MNNQKWLWEFTKRLVIMCVIIYAAVQAFAMVSMAVSQDFSALDTLIEEATEVMTVCVFGYCVKAGAENVIKIHQSKERNDEDD